MRESLENTVPGKELFPAIGNVERAEKILPAIDFEAPISPEDTETLERLSNLEDLEFVGQVRPVLRGLLKEIRKVEGNKIRADKWVHHMLPHFTNPSVENPLVVLPGTGCTYEKATGGCAMCNFGCEGREPSERDVDEALGYIFAHNEKMWKEHPEYQVGIVDLNAPGTFFNDQELSPELREYAYGRIRKFHEESGRLTVFICEGRFDQITEDKMIEMREHLGEEVLVDIGVGIESTDTLVREGVINKGLPNDWEQKARMIHELGRAGITAHVVMGAPFLTPKNAADDCERSLYELLKMENTDGEPLFETVLMMNMNKRPGTLIDYLERNGQYRLPNVFASVEVLSSLSERLTPEEFRRLRVFGLVGPENLVEAGTEYLKPCREGCDCEKVFNLLYRFRSTPEEMSALLEAVSGVGDECKLKHDFEDLKAEDVKAQEETGESADRAKVKKRIAKTYLLMARKFFPGLSESDAVQVFKTFK